MKVVHPNTIRTWTAEDNAKFKAMYLNGASYRALAEYFGGSVSSMEHRRRKLGLPTPTEFKEGVST